MFQRILSSLMMEVEIEWSGKVWVLISENAFETFKFTKGIGLTQVKATQAKVQSKPRIDNGFSEIQWRKYISIYFNRLLLNWEGCADAHKCEHNCLVILKICNAISSNFRKTSYDKKVHIKIKSKREGNRKDYDKRTRKSFWTTTEWELQRLRSGRYINR